MNSLNEKISEIITLYNNNNQTAALKALEEIISNNKDNIDLVVLFLEMCLKNNQISKAIDSYKILNNFKHINRHILEKIYPIFLEKGLFDHANDLIDRLLKLDKNNYKALRDKAFILFQKGNLTEAKSYSEKIQDNSLNDYFALNIRALILMKERSYLNAIDLLKKAINLNSGYLDSYNNIGLCFYELEQIDEAYYFFKTAFKINPNYTNTLINICNILSLRDKNHFAIKCYNNIIKKEPHNKKVISNLAIAYIRSKDKKNSDIYFSKAYENNKEDYELQYAYSSLLLNLNYFKEGWKYFESRLLLRKSYKIIKNYEKIKQKLSNTKHLKNNDKILIIREQGLGEEILFSGIYKEVINKFDVTIECDKRLLNIFQKSFNKKVFCEEGSITNNNAKLNNYNKVIFAGSMLKLFRSNIQDFKSRDDLKIPEEKFNTYKKIFAKYNQNLKIGISWRSIINIYGKLKSIEFTNFEPFFEGNRTIFNLQYKCTQEEIQLIKSKYKNFVNFENLDLFNDIESTMAVLKNLDVFITVSNSTAHIAASLGVKTIILCPKKSTTYFYWDTKNETSIWYKDVLAISIENSFKKTIDKVNYILDRFND